MTFFQAENLAVNFGGIRAVDDVSFAVEKGEVFTIIGPNGAGKTTIFNLVSRIYDPSAGRLLFEDRDITATPPHRIAELGIARTFQNIELFEHATLLQNLLLARHVHRNTGFFSELLFLPSVRRMEIEHREAVEKVIDFLDLQQYRDALVVNLPYGVRKIAELARALCDRSEAAAARRTFVRPQRRGDRRHGVLDRGHQESARHLGVDGRARHEARHRRLRPRARAKLWQAARNRDAPGGAKPS